MKKDKYGDVVMTGIVFLIKESGSIENAPQDVPTDSWMNIQTNSSRSVASKFTRTSLVELLEELAASMEWLISEVEKSQPPLDSDQDVTFSTTGADTRTTIMRKAIPTPEDKAKLEKAREVLSGVHSYLGVGCEI